MSDNHIPDDASDSGDSAVAELNRALAQNPELRGKTPPPAQDEWEDFEKLLAENPELAAPVPGSAPAATAFYYAMDKWACKHKSEPIKTDIERVPHDDEQYGNGINPVTGEFYEDALMISENPTLCPDCFRKWSVLEGDNAGEPTSSKDPSELPVAEPLPRCVLDIDNGDDEDGPAPNDRMNEPGIDDGPGKNKGVVDGQSDAEYDDDYYASDRSERSVSLPGSPRPEGYDGRDDDRVNDRDDAANDAARPPAGAPPPY